MRKIGAHGKPAIYVLNKIDKIPVNTNLLEEINKHIGDNEEIIPVSCIRGVNIDLLLEKIYVKLNRR